MKKRLGASFLLIMLLSLSACQKAQPKAEPSASVVVTDTATTEAEDPTEDGAECTASPDVEDQFTDETIENKKDLISRFPTTKNVEVIWEQLKNHYCTDESLSLYSHKDSKSVVLIANCQAKIRPEGDPSLETLGDREYPLAFIVQENTVFVFENFLEFGFMYQTGQLKFITDRNHDGNPEFWLEGTTYECDGEGECTDPCAGTGGNIVEVTRGKGVASRPVYR